MDVIPSFLQGPGDGWAPTFLGNHALHTGEVQEVIYPSDERSRSKKFIEYSVFVQHRENGTAITKIYPNCVLMNAFGGFADHVTYTLRADKTADKKDQKKQAGEPGKGSKVLILCLNGETNSAIIIGGVRDVALDKDPKTAAEKGHNLSFEFNGVAFEIDKDGQLTLTVKGATDAEGKTKNDKLPSTLKVEKDGKVTASTKGGKNSIVIEQTGKVTVTSEKEVVVNTKKAKITADKCSVVASQIELGAEGVGGVPANGVVLGSWIEPLTGSPVFTLGGTSSVAFAKK